MAAWFLEEPCPSCCRQSGQSGGGGPAPQLLGGLQQTSAGTAAPQLLGGLWQTSAGSAAPQLPGEALQTQAHQAGAGLLLQTQAAPAGAGLQLLTPVRPARARRGRPLGQACPAQARAGLLPTPTHPVQAKAGQLPCSGAPWSPAASGASLLPCSVAPASCRQRCGGTCQGTQRPLEQCSCISCGLAWWAPSGAEVSWGCSVPLGCLTGALQCWCLHQTIRCQLLTRSDLQTKQQALRKLLQPCSAILGKRQAAGDRGHLIVFEGAVQVWHINACGFLLLSWSSLQPRQAALPVLLVPSDNTMSHGAKQRDVSVALFEGICAGRQTQTQPASDVCLP